MKSTQDRLKSLLRGLGTMQTQEPVVGTQIDAVGRGGDRHTGDVILANLLRRRDQRGVRVTANRGLAFGEEDDTDRDCFDRALRCPRGPAGRRREMNRDRHLLARAVRVCRGDGEREGTTALEAGDLTAEAGGRAHHVPGGVGHRVVRDRAATGRGGRLPRDVTAPVGN